MSKERKQIHFYSGQMVHWTGSLWVVKDYQDVDGCRTVDLISCNWSNVVVHPSDTWPDDRPEDQIESIEIVASTVNKYFLGRMREMLGIGR